MDCRRFTRRLSQQIDLLRQTPRVEAPTDLEGRVVAALYDGFRQERVVDHLRAMPRRNVPNELFERVASSMPPSQAPAVLERLVSEELEDPARGITRRFTGKLSRQNAPEALNDRVEDLLEREHLTPPSMRRWTFGFAAAALVLVAASLWRSSETTRVEEGPRYSFRVERVDDVRELSTDSTTAALIAGVAGTIRMEAR